MVDELDREALQLERESVRLTQDQVIDSDNEVGDDSDNDSEPFCEDHFFIKCFKMVFIISYKTNYPKDFCLLNLQLLLFKFNMILLITQGDLNYDVIILNLPL